MSCNIPPGATTCVPKPNMAGTLIRRIISTALAPKPVGPYNQAVVADRTVYVSGVLGLDKDTNTLIPGGAAAEAKLALANLGKILEEAGSSYSNVVKATIFLEDITDFADVNNVYKEVFTKNYPARSTFQVGKLPLGAKFEIEVIALTGKVETAKL